ncbi:hypothetical protein BIV57_07950 [Mangrovactinospora gilvigrisea]|uniref:Aminoglycoside phosphotransferase domain-containing protein n=1 Tax=Mangrovactinospora gilvigrisea TaxID=1428644 RepID=A0A1J7BH75_9ACTN|nr:hypothetical protein BIV57_07950 [Mangrovactinospora gilvigrisea]
MAAVVRAAGRREPRPGGEPAHAEPLSTPIVSGTAGVWTVTGDGWQAVLKVLQRDADAAGGHPHWRAGDEPDHWYYWRREAEFFADADLRGAVERELHIPETYLVADRPDGTVALWMERVGGWASAGWPPDHYHRLARRVARLQGRLTGDRLPGRPWLGRRWLAAYQEIREDQGAILWDGGAWAHPALDGTGVRERAAEFRALWEARKERLAEVEALPRTLCHFDLHPYNLFEDDGRLGAIDWAFTGHGGVGEDAATLVFDTVFDFHVRPDEADRLFAEVVDGYALGLAEVAAEAAAEAGPTGGSGEGGDVREQVRRAVLTTAAAKYAWTMPAVLHALRDGMPMLNGRALGLSVPWWTQASLRLLDLVGTRGPAESDRRV